jgi:hypothetical protein
MEIELVPNRERHGVNSTEGRAFASRQGSCIQRKDLSLLVISTIITASQVALHVKTCTHGVLIGLRTSRHWNGSTAFEDDFDAD